MLTPPNTRSDLIGATPIVSVPLLSEIQDFCLFIGSVSL